MKKRIALIAHEQGMDELINLTSAHVDALRQCILSATAEAGKRIADEVGLTIERKLSGELGGYLQIGADIADGQIDYLIFLRDVTVSHPAESDVAAVLRACDVHNVAYATNATTAEILLSSLHAHSARHAHS